MASILVLDGPTGTELIGRGFKADPVLWTARAALEAPKLLKTIHLDYLRAGARLLTANTFRTTSHAFAKANASAKEAQRATQESVAIARDALVEFDCWERVFLAGSIGPLEDCYRPDLTPPDEVLERVHAETSSWLVDAGVDLVVVETMGTAREARIAVRAVRKAGADSAIASFITDETGQKLLGGDGLIEAAMDAITAGAETVMVNCVHPEVATRALEVLSPLTRNGIVIGAYANASRMHLCDDGGIEWEYDSRPLDERVKDYGSAARDWILRLGARIIGGCCGTGPEYIKALAAPDLRR